MLTQICYVTIWRHLSQGQCWLRSVMSQYGVTWARANVDSDLLCHNMASPEPGPMLTQICYVTIWCHLSQGQCWLRSVRSQYGVTWARANVDSDLLCHNMASPEPGPMWTQICYVTIWRHLSQGQCWLRSVRSQYGVTWARANVDSDLLSHNMASPGHTELTFHHLRHQATATTNAELLLFEYIIEFILIWNSLHQEKYVWNSCLSPGTMFVHQVFMSVRLTRLYILLSTTVEISHQLVHYAKIYLTHPLHGWKGSVLFLPVVIPMLYRLVTSPLICV